MYLEQVFESTQLTLERLRTGPLHQRAEGFTGWMLKVGYSPVTIRDHLRRIAYLNEYLGRRRAPPKKALTAKDIEKFFKWHRTHCRPKPSEGCIKLIRRSINRFTDYLGEAGLFDPLVEPPVYQPLLDGYLAWLRKYRHSAPATLKKRSNYVTKFMAWLGPSVTTIDLSELTPERVEEFSIAYARTTGRSGRQSMQTSLRTFLRFCLHKGYIQKPLDKAVPTLRTYKLSSVPRGLSEEQAHAALDSIDRSANAGRRDYAILQILYNYGVRNGQVRALLLKDIDWKANTILFRASKGGKDSLLPLTREVGESLLDYLQNARPPYPFPEVFLTCHPPYRPLPRASNISMMVRDHILSADIDVRGKGTNAFRHGFAKRMIKEGHSLKAVADLLGHRRLSTTFIYTKVDCDALKQVALEWPEEEI